MAGEKQPLQQLGIKIEQGNEIKKLDIEGAYKKEKENSIERFKKLGYDKESPIVKRHLSRLDRLKARLLKQLEELEAAKSSKEDEAKENLKTVRAKMHEDIKKSTTFLEKMWKDREEKQSNRKKAQEDAFKAASDLTDPKKDNAMVPDYEGWSTFEGSWYGNDQDDENKNNKTKNTLEGHVAAYRMIGNDMEDKRDLAMEEMKKAKDLHDKKDETGDAVDEVLTYDDMKNGLRMENVSGLQQTYDLASSSGGFVGGYLSYAYTKMPAYADNYKAYVFGKLKTIDLSYTLPSGADSDHHDYLKGRAQLAKLYVIESPTEWIRRVKEYSKNFEKLQSAALKLKLTLGIEGFNSALLNSLIDKDPAQITEADADDIEEAFILLEKEAYVFFHAKLDEFKEQVEKVLKRFEKVIERNKKLKKYTKKDIEAVLSAFESINKNVKRIDFSASDSLEDLLRKKDTFSTVRDDLKPLDKNVKEMEEGLKKHKKEEAEKKKVEEKKKKRKATGTAKGKRKKTATVSGGSKAWSGAKKETVKYKKSSRLKVITRGNPPYFDNKGNKLGHLKGGDTVTYMGNAKKVDGLKYILVDHAGKKVWVYEGAFEAAKGPKETKEVTSLSSFMKAKNLNETYEDGKYRYSLARPKVKNLGGSFQIDFGNPEVDSTCGEKMNEYFALLNKKIASEKFQKELKRLSERPDTSIGMVVDKSLAQIDLIFNKEEIARHQQMEDVIATAVNDSSMTFLNKPTASRIRARYNKDFSAPWKKAETHMDKSIEDLKRHGVDGGVDVDGVSVGPELAFLGSINVEYVDALSKIAVHGNDPGGIEFKIPFEQGVYSCRFHWDGHVYKLSYPGGSLRYRTIASAMKELNNGDVHKRLVEKCLFAEQWYEKYERRIGTVDEIEKGRTPGEIHLELDWTNPDAQVYLRPLPHGRVTYTIIRKYVGPNGESERSGYADSFKDFMVQLAHLRKWSEGGEGRERDSFKANREILFNTITNPYSYRNSEVESVAGRCIGIKTLNNEVVRVHFDWGGGNSKFSKKNATLDVWMGRKNGILNYKLKGPGVNTSIHTARNFDDMIRFVGGSRP